ncbi:MAG: ankyrin repeat domain-containing protein [Candidatus Marinamargulisbacteria bacterium]
MFYEHGVNINHVNKHGVTPLHLASTNGCLNVVKFLCENGVNVNQIDTNGMTPIFLASENSHLSVVRYLYRHHTTKGVFLCHLISSIPIYVLRFALFITCLTVTVCFRLCSVEPKEDV